MKGKEMTQCLLRSPALPFAPPNILDKVKWSAFLLWILTLNFLSVLITADKAPLIAAVPLIIVFILSTVNTASPLERRKLDPVVAPLLFFTASIGTISVLVNNSATKDILYFFTLLLFLFTLTFLARYSDVSLWSIVPLLSVISTGFSLVCILITLDIIPQHFYIYRNPSLSINVLAGVPLAIIWNKWFMRVLMMAPPVAVLIIIGQRTAILAGLISILAVIAFDVLQLTRKSIFLPWIFTITFVILTLLLVNKFPVNKVVLEIDSYLAITDYERGFRKLSDRIDIWSDAIAFIDKKLLYGNGPRANERLLPHGSAHNGLISTAMDYGLIVAVLWILAALRSLWRIFSGSSIWSRNQHYLIGMLFAGFGLAIGERYWFNMGNPFSVIFSLSVFMGLVSRAK